MYINPHIYIFIYKYMYIYNGECSNPRKHNVMQIFMKFREEENKIYIVFPTIKLKHYVNYIYIFCIPFNTRMYTCMHIM